MLTDIQIEKLLPLTKHERYGKILEDAINNWKNEDVDPKQGVWGVYIFNQFENIFRLGNDCACLLGAALINKHNCGEYLTTIVNNYNISSEEAKGILNGFDYPWRDSINEAEDFGSNVAKILFDE